jgi:hypothetical protein
LNEMIDSAEYRNHSLTRVVIWIRHALC